MLERLVRLESWATHERERTDYLTADISRRLQALEVAARQPLALGSPIKLLIAAGLLLAVLLTGDKAWLRLRASG